MTYNAGYVRAMEDVAEILASEGEALVRLSERFCVSLRCAVTGRVLGDVELRVRILEELTKKRPDQTDQGAAFGGPAGQ